MFRLELKVTTEYNAAQITTTHTSHLSLLQSFPDYSLLTRAIPQALTAHLAVALL
jgi:hypothetical protein